MAEANQILFDYKEVAEALIKKHGLHEGMWGVYLEFGLGTANLNTEQVPDSLTPAAIVAVRRIGLQRFPEPNNLTVDAAQVNPPPIASKRPHSSKKINRPTVR